VNRKISVGVIGAGTIAQLSHIPYLQDDDDRFELLAVADTNEALLDEVADRFHVPSRYTDYRRMLGRQDIESVVICHSGSHRDSVLAALEAGKDILVEKPLAWNVREVGEIAARAAASDRIVQLGYHKLYDPAFAAAKDEVRKIDDLGYARIAVLHPSAELNYTHARIRKGGGRIQEGYREPAGWDEQVAAQRAALASGPLAPLTDEALGDRRSDPAMRQFLGTLNISLIHSIYVMFGFLGKPARVRSVQLWRDTMSMQILVEYGPKLCCCLEWHHLPYLKDHREEFTFYGNRVRVSLEMPSAYLLNFPSPLTVTRSDGDRTWETRTVVSYEEAYRRELRDFHRCVVERRQPLAGVEDAVRHARFIQEVIDATPRSDS
jgi:predicted dehydrogenase